MKLLRFRQTTSSISLTKESIEDLVLKRLPPTWGNLADVTVKGPFLKCEYSLKENRQQKLISQLDEVLIFKISR